MKKYILKNILGQDIELCYNDNTKRILDEYKPENGSYIPFIDTIQMVCDELFNGLQKKDLTVLDIGANGGLFSLYCAPVCKKVYAIEPSAVLCRTIKEFTQEYDNVQICNNAISHKNGMINFFFFPDCTGQSTIHNRAKAKNAEAIKLSVNAYTIQTFIEKHNIEYVDICKVDIEGEEVNIFDEKTISSLSNKISKFWIEFHHTAHINGKSMDQNYNEIYSQFVSLGYKIFEDKEHFGFIAYK